MAAGARGVDSSIIIDECPMADGGEGTVDALVRATGGKFVTRRVTGPLPEMKVDATFGILGDGESAVIEMAAASGLHLLRPELYDPMRATTRGTGELLLAAAELGVKRIILGIGGSATVDGGVGCAEAATALRSGHVEMIVACDVTNPLYGIDGAARVFGPQKGATPAQVEQLDARLRALADELGAHDLANRPGARAAGGLGFGMMAFVNATLRPGVEIVIEATRLRDRLLGADLCLTGEGRFDKQSLAGKTPVGVARLCKQMGVPCIVIAGAVDSTNLRDEERTRAGVTAAVSLCTAGMTPHEAMQNSEVRLGLLTAQVVQQFGAASARGGSATFG
jgi:glycerate kinase